MTFLLVILVMGAFLRQLSATAIVACVLTVALVATVAGNEVTLAGSVAHLQPGRGFGFQIDFDESPKGTRQRLEELLAARGVAV